MISLFKLSSVTLYWVITAIIFSSSVKLHYSGASVVLAEDQPYITQFTPGIISLKQINIRVIKLRCISAARSWSNNTVVLTILTLRYMQCLHLMYADVAWVLVSPGTLSSAANHTRSRLPSRLSFRFLWLLFCFLSWNHSLRVPLGVKILFIYLFQILMLFYILIDCYYFFFCHRFYYLFYFKRFPIPSEQKDFVAPQLGFYFGKVHWQ